MKLLTLARDLHRRKAREKHSLFVAEGVRSVEELLRSGLAVRGALVAPQLASAPRGEALRKLLEQSRVEIEEISEKDFRSAAETESPQGIIAIGEVPSRSLDTLEIPSVCRILVLDAVQDPGNVGTILRTAAALGATATIALPGTVDLWNPKVIRGSMGAQFHHFAFHAEWAALCRLLDREKIELWAADPHGEQLEGTRAVERLAIVVGNEGSGLSPDVRAKADRTISLPIAKTVESLNVAVAAGIILHQLRP
ncbi:MAG: RNA methyltransferase [Gemmatimonadota bacterium]|nr:RNA methyltransferase [Gemmatimonadota bacterium]